MARIGQNPMRWSGSVRDSARCTVTTAVHIPMLSGYWLNSLDVLKVMMDSLAASTALPFDTIVFDNDSCQDVKTYLRELLEAKRISLLIESQRNLGKTGAQNVLFGAAQGEYIAYADSDVYFLPGWLEESIRVLQTFPEAGFVTAQPITGPISEERRRCAEAAKAVPDIQVTEGNDLVSIEQSTAYGKGISESEEAYAKRMKDRIDILIQRGETKAYVAGSHFQFTVRKETIAGLLPLQAVYSLSPEDDASFDRGIAQKGLWRLSTYDYLVHHLGNTVSDLRAELPWVNNLHGIIYSLPKTASKAVHNPLMRALLKKLNALTFRLLYGR